jgi:dienelactone hydrolase
MLESFLKTQVAELLSRRRREVAATTTPAQITQRQKKLKSFFLQSLGDFPERTPLNPQFVGSRQYPGYRIERIIFESRPGHKVTAVLYLPAGKPPFPGVLVPCGHSANGKAAESYQRVCILLAKNGMAAFCYDPIGQGERIQMLDSSGKPAIREGSTTEHTLAGIGALLVGRQAATYRTWDGFRALDYLAGRPEIDPARLGCTGNSGGGTMTAYLMALDDRIAVAAPSCFITSLGRLFATIGPQDAEQNITGQVAAGMDHADYATLRAPKPTLLSVGTRDFFDIQGSWDTFRELKLLYGRLGFGERVDLFESDEPHGFTMPRRVSAVRWMRRWLLQIDDAITETDSPIATDQELQCTRTGQVLGEEHGVSVFDLNAQRARELRGARAEFCKSSSASVRRSRIKELLGLADMRIDARRIDMTGESPKQGYRQRDFVLESEPGIAIAAVDLVPDAPDSRAAVLVKFGADRAVELADGSPTSRLAQSGRRVVLADLRGMGVTAPPTTPGRSDTRSDSDAREAFLALHIGRPLLGQRVFDLLCLLESLHARDGSRDAPNFDVMGIGPAGLAVLHAAALDEKGLIEHVVLERTLVSWTDVVERGVSRGQIAGVIPGALAYYDLPDLAARLNPCPLTIRHSTNAIGRPVTQAELEAAYSACLLAYGDRSKLTLQAGP